MANVQTDALPSVAALAAGDTIVGNDASSGDTAQFTLAALDGRFGTGGANPTGTAGLATVNGAATTFLRSDGAPPISQSITPTWTNTHRFKTGGFNDMAIELGATNFGLAQYSTNSILFQCGTNNVGGSLSSGGASPVGFGVTSTGRFGFAASGDPVSSQWDVALGRAAAGVVEVNDGTLGAGHGKAINFPQTAADADAPAPASGATLYSKQVGGKNALFVRFPTGVVQQLAIEI